MKSAVALISVVLFAFPCFAQEVGPEFKPILISPPPYPGQGNPLPAEIGLEGVWLKEDLIALIKGEAWTPFRSPSGRNFVTLDMEKAAAMLGITVDRLLQENGAHTLRVKILQLEGTEGHWLWEVTLSCCGGKYWRTGLGIERITPPP